MKESKAVENKDQPEEQGYRGMVVVPYVRGLSEQFRQLAARHSFRTAFKPASKIRELKKRAQEPLGEKQKSVIYEITCKCNNAVYVAGNEEVI